VAKERPGAAVFGCRDDSEARGSILLTTVDEAAWGVSMRAVGVVVFGEEILVVTDVGVFPAIIVRDARLLLLLLPTAENVGAWAEADAVRVLLEATSTVLLTG